MSVIIPESVKSYCENRGVRTAIDVLSEQGEDYLPDHLEWDELSSYYKSVLAAATVRADFALFYLDLWDAIWKPALEDCGITDPWTVDDMNGVGENKPSLQTLWADGLYRVHYHPHKEHTRIDTHVTVKISQKNKISQKKFIIIISLASWNEEENPQEIDLPSEWQPSKSKFDGWYNTTEAAFPAIDPATTIEIDCTPIRQAAEQALRQLMRV